MKMASHAMKRLFDLYSNVLKNCRLKNLRNFSYLDRLHAECAVPLIEQLEPRVMLSGLPLGDSLREVSDSVGVQPTLVIDDVTMTHNEHTLDITLPETDGDGQVIVYSVQTIQPEDEAYNLKTQLGLTTYLPKYDNYRGTGLKWMRNNLGQYFYIQPDGEVTQYRVGVVGQVSTDCYADPQAWIDAPQQTIPNLGDFISITGNVLTVQPALDFVGTFSVQATATDNETDPVSDTFSITVNNNSPVWTEQAADQVLSHNVPCVVSLSATDPDTDSLSYSFAVNTAGADAYALKTDLGLATYIPRYDNLRGAGNKWFRSDSGIYYYIKPTGEVYRHRGSQVGQLDTYYADNPQALIDQPAMEAPDITFSYVAGELTIDQPADFVGTFQVDVTATDGAADINDSFTITVTNDGPVWENIPDDQTMSHNLDTLVLPFSATDADGDAVTYTAVVGTSATDAYTLKTDLGLATYIPKYDNLRGAGNKWFRSDSGVYYYIKPTGEVYRNRGSQVGQLDAYYAENPQALIDQGPVDTPTVTLTVAAGQLTIDPPADFVGTFQVDVTASDGNSTTQGTFFVEVINLAPTTPIIADQTVSHDDLPMTVDLGPTTDADNDVVTYSVEVDTSAADAYTLKTDLGLATYIPKYDNLRGVGQKWFRSDSGIYYYIKPTGEVYRHRGSQVGQLDTYYAENPQALIDQQSFATPNVAFTINNSGDTTTCTIEPPADFTGTFKVNVSASDGENDAHTDFIITVTNAGPVWENLPVDQTISHNDSPLVLPFLATDTDGDTITYTAVTATADVVLTIDNGELTVNPPADFVGDIQIDVSATDGLSTISDTFVITVTNADPVWENLPVDQTMSHNADTLVLPFLATDTDGDTITYTAVTATADVVLTVANGELTVNPPADFVGDIQIDVSATDGLSTIQDSFTVTVENIAPVLSLPDKSVAPDALPLTVDLGPTLDAEGDTVTYTVETVTSNVTITIDDSGEITTCTIEPPAEFLGAIQLDVSATDGVNTVTDTFNMLVEETPSITMVDFWFVETSAGVWDVSVSITGSETAGLSAYGIWVYADPALVTYTENTLWTYGAGYVAVGFPPANLMQGDVGGNFNAGNYQASLASAILGIGKIPVDEQSTIPEISGVSLGVPALLGTLTTPEGLGVGDFDFDGFGLYNAAGDGYITSRPTPTIHIDPI